MKYSSKPRQKFGQRGRRGGRMDVEQRFLSLMRGWELEQKMGDAYWPWAVRQEYEKRRIDMPQDRES